MWQKAAYEHAKTEHPNESCAIIYEENNKLIYGKCRNIAKDFESVSFVIEPEDWAKYEDMGDIKGLVHSHPNGQLRFSEADIASCNYLDVDFYLVDPFTSTTIHLKPMKYEKKN